METDYAVAVRKVAEALTALEKLTVTTMHSDVRWVDFVDARQYARLSQAMLLRRFTLNKLAEQKADKEWQPQLEMWESKRAEEQANKADEEGTWEAEFHG